MPKTTVTRTSSRRVILGPPGTGKTRRLLEVAREAPPGFPPLFISHTRAAAKELSERCEVRGAEASTIHSLCYGLLNMNRHQVVDNNKLKAFGELTGFDFTRTGSDDNPNEILKLIELAGCTGRDLDDVYAESHRPCSYDDLVYFSESYLNWKMSYGYKDYNDMLTDAVRTVKELPYQYIFVDEAQDLSPLQWDVVALLARNAKLLVAAGDDDQAIFEWGGAWPGGLANFIMAENADIATLNQSYRVPRTVHRLAEKVSSRISQRIHKPYEARPIDGTVDSVGGFESLSRDELDGATVLYRDITMRGSIDEKLMSMGLSYRARGGLPSPYDSRWGVAWRSFDAWRRGQSITDKQHDNLLRCLLPWAVDVLNNEGFSQIQDKYPSEILDLPMGWAFYFDEVDLIRPPQVTISTIHGYKGAEADKVVLCTSMSERVTEEYAIKPDAEHRVFYVGVTRARESLIIVGGQNEYPL